MSIISRGQKLSFSIILLGILVLILENAHVEGYLANIICHAIDLSITILFASETLIYFYKSETKITFLKKNVLEVSFVTAFVAIIVFGKYYHFFIEEFEGHRIPVKLIVFISVFNAVKVVMRIKKLQYFLRNLTSHPAQTIMLSFFGVILAGTILLMMPFSVEDGETIGFINSLFTAASATCVTGLTVVDTATKFSIFGKIVIMSLIQIGGLGIMILAYFTAFLVGRKLTYQDKVAISYMLDEDDVRNLNKGIKNIVLFTFIFEFAGAMLLYLAFMKFEGFGIKNMFYSMFHSVSAFCNAGFALFTDNLEQYKSSVLVNFVISGLIIAGGISFMVLGNTYGNLRNLFKRKILKRPQRVEKLTLNTKVVLFTTALLLISGTLLIYKLEHKDNLLEFGLGTQYLMAFFQTVTLRTAGFNTMDISKLHMATYSLMILFMYIGGASGSCAGGIKVNTLGVVWGYVKSIFNNKDDVVLLKHAISKDLINQAFLIMFLSATLIFGGSLLLALTENQKFIRILFEVTSAFGTVGLSTGITPDLSAPGKIVITLIMFIGRLGPLTIITALSQKTRKYEIKYPIGKLNIG